MNRKINITKILLFITILALENFCCLIPTTGYIIPNIKYSDIGIILAVLFTAWVFLTTKKKKIVQKTKYPYLGFILAYIIIVIFSSIMAYHFFGQPVLWGIRSQRQILICLILYFPIMKSLQSGTLKKENIIKMIIVISVFELIIFILQYILANKVVFTYIDTTEIRYSSVRLRFPYLLSLIGGLISLDNIMNGNKKIVYYLCIFGSIFLLAGICKYRAPSIALFIAYIVGFLLWKKKIENKIVIGVLLGSFALAFLYNSPIIQTSLKVVSNNSNTVDDTLTIRKEGQEYYIDKIKESPIVGFGMPNLNCYDAMIASGVNNYYYLVDNGIIGFTYIHGLSGLIWLVLIFLVSIKKSYKIYKKRNTMIYVLYFIFELGNIYIGMHWFYIYTIPFVLVFTLLDYEWLIESKGDQYEKK